MTDLLRLAFMGLALVVVGLVAAAQQPEWAQDLRLESFEFPVGSMGLPLDDHDRAIARRIREKGYVTDELLDGRLTLLEAAALFTRLDEKDPNYHGYVASPGLSGEERSCREVIAWAHQRSRERPPRATNPVLAHLEEEWHRHTEQSHALLVHNAAPDAE